MAEWSIPFTLKTPKGTLKFNTGQGGSGVNANDLYLFDEAKCHAGLASLRTQNDDSPQSDGAIFHRSFKSYYVASLDVELWLGAPGSADPACEADRVRMLDNLMLHVNALVDPELADLEAGNCQFKWDPSGAIPARMMNQVRLLTWPQETLETPLMTLAFELESPFPYTMDVAETVTVIDASETVTNLGTTDFFPVFKVHGPVSQFSIQNATDLMFIDYDAALPGAVAIAGGHYAEIDTFHNTIFLDGNGANLMAGLDVATSDFWQLVVGANSLSYTSDNVLSSCEMLWNNAWA